MKKVAVLLSSYNGSMYIEEQIISILNQKNVSVDLYIRDDGSTDDTLSIIEKFQGIYLTKGINEGVTKSFFLLIEMLNKGYDYYAFCDQDDVWLENKLDNAINSIYPKDINRALLVCDSYYLTDKNLSIIREVNLYDSYSTENIMIEGFFPGCTLVFNHKLFEIIKKSLESDIAWKVSIHDKWVVMIASFFGDIVINNIPSIYYRQHENNVIGGNISFKSRLLKFNTNIRKEIKGISFVNDLVIFFNVFKNDIENVKNIKMLIGMRHNFLERLKVFFSCKIIKKNIFKTIIFKIKVILCILN